MDLTRMRVIQLGPFPPPHGGVQTNLVAIRDHLRRCGHRAGVVNLYRYRQKEADEVYYPTTPLETVKVLLREPADILHFHIGGNLTSRLLGIALFCAWMPGRKSVLTFHSGGFCSSSEGQAITPSGIPAWIFRRLDAIIAVNAQIRDFFVKQCGVAEKRVHLISPHATVRAEAELPPALQRFFDAHQPLLLCVCGLEPEYDVPIQVEAFGDTLKKFPNAGLAILGSGSQKNAIQALIASKSYADHILLAGDTPHAATLRAIQECSMLLRTTHYDGDALSVREAIDLGTPVVATDNGMRPGGCHLIPMPPQLKPLVARIEQVLTMPVQKAKAPPEGEAGNETLDQVIALYESLLH